mgnify:CR=1 FL=1
MDDFLMDDFGNLDESDNSQIHDILIHDLIGLSVYSKVFRDLIKSIGKSSIKTPELHLHDDCSYVCCYSSGLEVAFENTNRISTIFLQNKGKKYQIYQGRFPYNLSFNDSRSQSEEKLGSAADEDLSDHYSSWKKQGISISYNSKNEKGKWSHITHFVLKEKEQTLTDILPSEKLGWLLKSSNEFDPSLINSIKFKIHPLIIKSNFLQEIFKKLDLSFTLFKANKKDLLLPDDLNVCFDYRVPFQIIHFVTDIMHSIYAYDFDIYISYAAEPSSYSNTITCGSYLTNKEKYTNVSACLRPESILELNPQETISLSLIFPVETIASHGKCLPSKSKEELKLKVVKDQEDIDYDYGDINQMGLDELSQNDPDWHWNID